MSNYLNAAVTGCEAIVDAGGNGHIHTTAFVTSNGTLGPLEDTSDLIDEGMGREFRKLDTALQIVAVETCSSIQSLLRSTPMRQTKVGRRGCALAFS